MKEEVKPSIMLTPEANTPDTLCINNTEAENESSNNEEETFQGSAHTSTTSLPQSAAKGKRKAVDTPNALPSISTPGLGSAKPDTEAKAANLVGKINNLISTHLGNITEGRYFLFVGEFQCRGICGKNVLIPTIQFYMAHCNQPFVHYFYIVSLAGGMACPPTKTNVPKLETQCSGWHECHGDFHSFAWIQSCAI